VIRTALRVPAPPFGRGFEVGTRCADDPLPGRHPQPPLAVVEQGEHGVAGETLSRSDGGEAIPPEALQTRTDGADPDRTVRINEDRIDVFGVRPAIDPYAADGAALDAGQPGRGPDPEHSVRPLRQRLDRDPLAVFGRDNVSGRSVELEEGSRRADPEAALLVLEDAAHQVLVTDADAAGAIPRELA